MPGLTGQSIGHYHIREQLGEGGMATVYKAYDTRLERDIALKVLRAEIFSPILLQQVLQRFERESKSLAKLSQPNIVNILDYGEYESMPYLVMEYLPGGTLKQKLGQPIPWQQAIHLLIPVADGLSYAHQHGIIHRDVKPANILLKETGVPVLTDFGIAKLLENVDGQTLTTSGVGIGTPEYMAPEQGMGSKNIDARADIYALGIVFYEMVTGRKPYMADTPMAVVLKQISDPLPHPTQFVPGLPEEVENVLFKALAKQPDDRYQDMTAMLAALESLLLEAPTAPVAAAPQVDLNTLDSPAPTLAAPTRIARETAPARFRFSPKALIIAGSLIAILLLALFALPALLRQLPAAPGATTTSETASINSPAPSNTPLPPSAVPTVSPTRPLTMTPWPTHTVTPQPAWVTDFAEPILATIKNRKPDLQDDFISDTNDWHGSVIIKNGIMQIKPNSEVTNPYFFNKSNFVLEMEIPRPNFNVFIYFNGIDFEIENQYLDCVIWKITKQNHPIQLWSGFVNRNDIQLLIIVKDFKIAYYVQGKAEYLLDYTKKESDQVSFRCSGFLCKINYIKVWELR